jgi:hypothetical protein
MLDALETRETSKDSKQVKQSRGDPIPNFINIVGSIR